MNLLRANMYRVDTATIAYSRECTFNAMRSRTERERVDRSMSVTASAIRQRAHNVGVNEVFANPDRYPSGYSVPYNAALLRDRVCRSRSRLSSYDPSCSTQSVGRCPLCTGSAGCVTTTSPVTRVGAVALIQAQYSGSRVLIFLFRLISDLQHLLDVNWTYVPAGTSLPSDVKYARRLREDSAPFDNQCDFCRTQYPPYSAVWRHFDGREDTLLQRRRPLIRAVRARQYLE